MTHTNSIPSYFLKKKRRKSFTHVPPGADPGRRLIAAIVNLALMDYYMPPASLDAQHYDSAANFLQSDDCRIFLNQLGISWSQIEAVLGPTAAQSSDQEAR